MSTAFSSMVFSSAVVASPDSAFRTKLIESLRVSHCNVQEARGGAEALAKLEAGGCQALLLDHWLPDLDVAEFLHIVKRRHPQLKIVVINSKTEEPARQADSSPRSEGRDAGEPWQPVEPISNSDVAPEVSQEPEPLRTVSAASSAVQPLPGMIGVSPAMQNVSRMSRLVALRSTTVLLTGETGTGKELVAKAIHLLSPRHRQPFITVNCAAIPESLLEAELFGYARGAFTGAFQSRMGRIHAAHGGTLFLDEVGELPLSMQAKLLRFLQEGEVQRLGGPDIIRVDVRVIAATNAQLAKRVAEKAFREDLYYRVSVFPIDLVPLRDRPEDIYPLGHHFLAAFCQEASIACKAISDSALRLLSNHSWPGNVRELRHVMERAFILSENEREILADHISMQTPWR
ncbi:MAG TPA: sigma-54 dependent transcriptional regulator [Terriglobia bacterium]|nr:sigma-54 dependent transcriptional regulator [Terriglobia bacterium]